MKGRRGMREIEGIIVREKKKEEGTEITEIIVIIVITVIIEITVINLMRKTRKTKEIVMNSVIEAKECQKRDMMMMRIDDK
jgi:Mn2+/Fe2+ NRAMP family transporter